MKRAALFLGLGLNGVNQPGFRDYELHKLPPGDNLAALPSDIIARGAPDHEIDHFKQTFSTWVTGCGLREMLEHYGLMLDHIHKNSLVVAQSRQFLDVLGDPEKLQYEFARRLGIPDKHDRLKKRFQIEPGLASHIDALYDARNALSHGLGIVRPEDVGPDGALVMRWLAIEMHGHGEDTNNVIPVGVLFGKPLPEQMRMKVSTAQRERSYKVGDKVALTAQDLYEICFFMMQHMNPKTTAAFVKFLKEQGVEEAQKADGDAGLTSHDQRFDNIDRELHSIRTELDDLQEKVDNITGYRKEIDHALERVTAIEKHLGLDRKISA